jgi:hypothetical protein
MYDLINSLLAACDSSGVVPLAEKYLQFKADFDCPRRVRHACDTCNRMMIVQLEQHCALGESQSYSTTAVCATRLSLHCMYQ